MFPFWEIGVGKMAEIDSGKPVPNFMNFGHFLVSFRPGNLMIFQILELTSGGWNS